MNVLFVCLGNICRSPTAHGVLAYKLQEKSIDWINVDSAGTASYHIGKSPDTRSQQVARDFGYDLSSLKARQLTDADFYDYNYIFAMDNENLKNINQRKPADGTAIIELALDQTAINNLEVPDPYYGGDRGFEIVIELCEAISDSIIERLLKDSAHG